jgi:hypothetical protein
MVGRAHIVEERRGIVALLAMWMDNNGHFLKGGV